MREHAVFSGVFGACDVVFQGLTNEGKQVIVGG